MIDRFAEIELNRREAETIAQDLEQTLRVPIRNLLQIDTFRDKQLAATVLPVLADWLPKATRGGVRATLYTLFQTRYAHGFLSRMIDWLRIEVHPPAISALKFAIKIAMRPSDADLVWSVLKFKDLDGADVPFLLQLAKSKNIGAEVNDVIWAGLRSGTFSVFSFDRISNVHDNRIQEELLSRATDPDPEVRKQVRRLFERGRPLPPPLRKVRTGPNRRLDLFSMEVDADQLFSILTLVETQFGVRLPPDLSDLAFLEALPVDKWVTSPADSGREECAFWFRLETDEVVEVVLQHASKGRQGTRG